MYKSTLRFLACFRLVLPASPTFFNGLSPHTRRSFDNREWRRLSCSGKFARLQPQGQFYAT